ncbi:putative ESCRT-II complex, Vps25 subunit, winged helix-like DNA-binding domain superfamily [Septoria linicola]|nr:putative ESCRT-II complex, Vps25 subunit, winged helix-like DNA-binding domain superfamily [Septoria linicola]
MSTASPEPSIAGLSWGGATSTAAKFEFPSYASFPPFYTLQPNSTTRARQLELWSSLVTSYCAYHRLFRLSLSAPPADLFANSSISRSLKPADIRAIIDHMSQPSNGPSAEWIVPTGRGETSNTCYVYWKTPAEWADLIYTFIEETGQKGAVLTIYELREGESSLGREWKDIDEALLRKALGVLVKRGKAQVFGQEENAGVKFF